METTGRRFKEIRTALNLSQEAIGERINLTKSGVSAVENDKSFVSIDIMRTLFFDLKINLNYLICGFGLKFIDVCENTHAFIKNEKPVEKFKNWGSRLSTMLADAEETPYAFSKRTGIKESRIEKFILDSVEPTVAELNAIKSNVDVSMDWLLYGETIESCAQDKKVSLSADEIMLLKKLAKKSVF